jgi:hypothetical protein
LTILSLYTIGYDGASALDQRNAEQTAAAAEQQNRYVHVPSTGCQTSYLLKLEYICNVFLTKS